MSSGDREPTRRHCPPEVKGMISFVDDLMSKDPRYHNAGTPGQVIQELMEAGLVSDFVEFEGWLRECDSRVHLVAVPLDYYGGEWSDKSKYVAFQGDKVGDPEFTLWIGVNGAPEADDILRALGITAEENLDRLQRTGILVTDS